MIEKIGIFYCVFGVINKEYNFGVNRNFEHIKNLLSGRTVITPSYTDQRFKIHNKGFSWRGRAGEKFFQREKKYEKHFRAVSEAMI